MSPSMVAWKKSQSMPEAVVVVVVVAAAAEGEEVVRQRLEGTGVTMQSPPRRIAGEWLLCCGVHAGR